MSFQRLISAALQASNPGLRIMSAEEAKRLNILPSQQGAGQQAAGRQGAAPSTLGPAASSLRSSPQSTPPVAVVQGKPIQHPHQPASR